MEKILRSFHAVWGPIKIEGLTRCGHQQWLPAASQKRHNSLTINLETGVRSQAACDSILKFGSETNHDDERRTLLSVNFAIDWIDVSIRNIDF